ncbi:hypothetical protein DICVIV_04977 [Dictyocaulus viviparus]|uniref:NET domain-containing protein n=1 Tax=Dictyocaulus viviparus TaxID=29172 RepID=A0A0D8XYH9_DICVI|nr:hypothetical protein DICVIV_04977 [Dictyocaulus viviparus]
MSGSTMNDDVANDIQMWHTSTELASETNQDVALEANTKTEASEEITKPAKNAKRRKSGTRRKRSTTRKLPRRSSTRLKQKQAEHVDYSQLPPKYEGPPSQSMRFCNFVLSDLMSSKYQPINWLIDLATVKRKLIYKQYANAEEFANEIRTTKNTIAKAQALVRELSLQEQYLGDMKYVRENARCQMKTPPKVIQSVWDSAYATFEKCGALPVYKNVKTEQNNEVCDKTEDYTVSEEPANIPPLDTKSDCGQDAVLANKESNLNQDGTDGSLSYIEQLQLAEDLKLLSDDEMSAIVDIILKHNTVKIPNDEKSVVSIFFRELKPATLREMATYIDSVLNSVPSPAKTAPKSRSGKSKNVVARKQSQPTKKRAVIVDIEARKRELMEGIKRLGGTGATKPIRKQTPYVDQYARVRNAYVHVATSVSSSSTSASESWQSSSSSETVEE